MKKADVTSTNHILPFGELSPAQFERLCLWLVEREGYLRPEHLGEAGSEQGRDVIAYREVGSGEQIWYFQCKRHQRLGATTLINEVKKYNLLAIADPAKKPFGIVFVSNATLSADAREKVRQFCREHEYECEFWARTELDLHVKKYDDISKEFFDTRLACEDEGSRMQSKANRSVIIYGDATGTTIITGDSDAHGATSAPAVPKDDISIARLPIAGSGLPCQEREREATNPLFLTTKAVGPDTPVKRVLIIAACPRDATRIRLDREVREICEVLWSAATVKFIVEVIWAVRVEDLTGALLRFRPQIVHFSCHGTEEGIILEDDRGISRVVSHHALAGLFSLFGDSVEGVVEAVFFNACFTEGHAEAVSPYVDYIIGTRNALRDEDAIALSSHFYEALASGSSWEFAFEYAVRAAKLKGDTANFTPIIRKTDRLPRPIPSGSYSLRECESSATRVLFAGASPQDAFPLRLGEELREICQALALPIRQGQVVVQQRWSTRFQDLHRALLDFKPQVVHFSAHGCKEGLVFEDEQGCIQIVSKTSLARLFSLFAGHVECVVLNANFSNEIAREISKHCRYAVGVRGILGDEGAIAFSVGFYMSLAAGTSFEDAFKSGCLHFEQRTMERSSPYSLHKQERMLQRS